MNLDIEFRSFGLAITDKNWVTLPQPNIGNLYYVISGHAYYIQNGTEYKMLPEHIYILPATLYVERKYTPGEPFVHLFFDYITVPVINVNKVLDINAADYPAVQYTVKAFTELFFDLTNRNGSYVCKPETSDNTELITLAKNYFCALIMLINTIYPLDGVYDARVSNTIQYIRDNYMNDITIQELADRVFLEKNYFIKLFKMCMNTTPHNYLRNHRLNMAVMMLKKGKSITETAYLCGFKSESSFSQAMKKVMGLSPSQIPE